MNNSIEKQPAKIVVILGPTASGKSDVAIKLAQKYNGEIISADSRQIYKGMDIGTGKIIRDFSVSNAKFKNKRLIPYWSGGIPHYLIDITNPRTNYNVYNFKKDTEIIIENILLRRKLPIICGGTGFWIKSIVDDIIFPEVKPDKLLRNKLRNKPAEELFKTLRRLDPRRAKEIDKNNKVRLIRAIEICKAIGRVPTSPSTLSPYQKEGWDEVKFLQIGIDIPKEKLHKQIKARLDKRFKQGMVTEVKDLHIKNKVSWKKLESFGLEYRWIARYLQGKIKLPEMKEELYKDIKKYAKRQMTWFRKDKRIKWLKSYKEIEKEVRKF